MEDDAATTARVSVEAPASSPADGEGGGEGRGREKEEWEEADEGEEGDVEEEGYRLGLDDETDLQDFVGEDTHGVELYQQLERLEYEALAPKKRKALHEQENCSGETTKKPKRGEEDKDRERILERGLASGLEDRGVVEMEEDEGRGGGREVEEEEEWEEEEEGEEGEEEEGYRLQFDGEMDPLDFVQEDANGVELYQQFERLEYEALAERKRKTLHEQQSRGESTKKPRQEEFLGVTMEEINEMMNFGSRRRSKTVWHPKKRGRKKGSKNKLSPEVSRKIGDATLHYASGDYDEAIPLLEEVVRLAPNLPDAYYVLGLIYDAKGDKKKALNFHMIAAHLTPKDPSLWKKLVAWSIEQKNIGQVRYCLSKAITADPKDVGLRFDRALLHVELGEYQKAAESYAQIVAIYPASIEACKMAAKMYRKCGQVQRAISILEDCVNGHASETDLGAVNLLISLYMENNSHNKALRQIEHAHTAYCLEKGLPLHLKTKEVICHAHLGNMEHAEVLLQDMQMEHAADKGDLITEVADSLADLKRYDYALKFYLMLEGIAGHGNGGLHLKIAQCYIALKERGKAIPFFYKALSAMEDNIDARLNLSSIFLEEGKDDEAIILLSPPKSSEPVFDLCSMNSKPWWFSGKIKMQLAKIYHAKGMLEDFAETIFSCIRETLLVESMNRKVRRAKRLPKSVLFERVKLLGDQHADNVFHGFKPIATTSELTKAARAKKLLQKKQALREEKKAALLAAGVDWQSEDSENEVPRKEIQEPPLPGLLTNEENYELVLDLCKALASLQRYCEALEIINHTLRLAYNTISMEKKEVLRSLGAQIAYNTSDPQHGYNYVRYMVQQHPYSIAAWNCYYKVVTRFDTRFSRHFKFLHYVLVSRRDCVPALLINGHQFTMISQHQTAAREYLEAYKLQPENTLINLCVGTALINLALGFRLKNKHKCVAQGLAFLYNYLRICNNSQEALYNVARACQHVGLVTLAASYYEKVLTIQQKDYPIPKLPYEASSIPQHRKPGYCNLQREAAYNLHLIYKKSGAIDLARQILKDYCTF
ncbi:general transcription factor 3C polypeptide 3 isoform X2 [Phoenix dactylifera]|uniref:General transcription factor 3C polypeptide 3 isoform X2 n=1 Tax=Phoenix dactylifera TaxID=42345 RepID=A0A8B7BVN8_PHODC|nr:general transcription factor 3C polypeptide 3 isoform X2 [Phoenix dactylifera]